MSRDPWKERRIEEEWLDSMDPALPAARRSRRDLRLLDFWLGNSRWIIRTLRRRVGRWWDEGPEFAVELGAGDGRLADRVARLFPGRRVLALDRQPLVASGKPRGPRAVRVSGNLLETLPGIRAGVAFGALILHHFDDADLARIGRELARFRLLIFVEPWRSARALRLARLGGMLFGPVTRHDMPASLRAGFRPGELGGALGLGDAGVWRVRESVCWRGSLRMVAWRH